MIVAMDYVGSFIELEGRNDAAIGYEIQIDPFITIFNLVDRRYKVGADFDLLLKYRHGVTNRDQCAEGTADGDEYRIVETNSSDRPSTFRLSASGDDRFHVTQQFEHYQVLQRR